MGKKSEYLEELERQYQKKHRLKLKLERELAALKSGSGIVEKNVKEPKLPMLEHPKDLLKKAPMPPKVVKEKKRSKNIVVKDFVKEEIVSQEEIPKKSESLIDWSDLFGTKKEHMPVIEIIHEDDLKPKTLEEAFEREPVVEEKHEIPKEFAEMDEVFKKYNHDDVFNPKKKALYLVGKVYEELQKGNVDMGEYFYKQIQPQYGKLTGWDKKEVYDELMLLQNEFVMLKMNSWKEDINAMPTRNYKLSTIMAKEKKIDTKLAKNLMAYEDERTEEELELDKKISADYTKEEKEAEREYLREVAEIARKIKRKEAREEAKRKKVAKEKLELAKKKARKKKADEKKRLKKELELDKKITRKLIVEKKRVSKKELELDKMAGNEFIEKKNANLKKTMKKELVVEKQVMKGLKRIEKLLDKAPLPPKKKKAKKKAKK